MKKTSITDLKANLSARVREVRSGDPYLVTDRGRAVAVLQCLRGPEGNERIGGLIQKGVVAPAGRKPRVEAFLKRPKGVSRKALSAAVTEDREGR